MKKIAIFFMIIFFISACASIPQHRLNAFNEADFLPTAGIGDSKIIGQAFLKTKGGDVKYGAGNEVVLVPVTPYTQETHERAIIRGERLEQHDQRYLKYRRTTRADGQGNFEFNNIPAGDYYLACPIFWQIPSRSWPETTGGVAYSRVSVKPGETVKAIVTR
jgi:hypothetical protein